MNVIVLYCSVACFSFFSFDVDIWRSIAYFKLLLNVPQNGFTIILPLMDMWAVSNSGALRAMGNASLNILIQAFCAHVLNTWKWSCWMEYTGVWCFYSSGHTVLPKRLYATPKHRRGPPGPYRLASSSYYTFFLFLLSWRIKKNLSIAFISLITAEIGELYVYLLFKKIFFALFASHLYVCFTHFWIGLMA